MLITKAKCLKSKKENLNLGVQSKILGLNNIITFPCVRQNPFVIVLTSYKLVSCNMDQVQVSVSVLTWCFYFNKADFHTCEGMSRESDIESFSDGSGAF